MPYSGMATVRSTGTWLSLAIAVGVLASACGALSAPPSVAPTTPMASSSDLASPAATPLTPSALPSTPGASAGITVAPGEVGVTPLGSRVTVHSFGPSDRSPEPPPASAWLEADLEWCLSEATTREVTVGNIRYEVALELSDGTRISPEMRADSPDEVYASEGTFGAGECVRGAMVFAVPAGTRPAYLVLARREGALRWALPSVEP